MKREETAKYARVFGDLELIPRDRDKWILSQKRDLTKELGRRIETEARETRAVAFIRELMALAVQWDNAQIIFGRTPRGGLGGQSWATFSLLMRLRPHT